MNKSRHYPHVRPESLSRSAPRGPALRSNEANPPHCFCGQHALHNPVNHLLVLFGAKLSFWRGGASRVSGRASACRRQGWSFGRITSAASVFAAADRVMRETRRTVKDGAFAWKRWMNDRIKEFSPHTHHQHHPVGIWPGQWPYLLIKMKSDGKQSRA